MKLGLIGFPQVGKRTLFHLLTGQKPNGELSPGGIPGLARVRDERFDWLVEIYRPRLKTPAQMELVLLPDLGKQPAPNAKIFEALGEVEAICHLVRAFADERVFHLEGGVEPRRDIIRVNEELQLHDLLFIEKRLERLGKERGRKNGGPPAALEADLLPRLKRHLEAGGLLSSFPLSPEEEKFLRSCPLLTRKPLLIILNTGEDQPIRPDGMEMAELMASLFPPAVSWMSVSAKIEQELSFLLPEEHRAFLDELNLSRPALDRLTLLCFQALGLISFFTVGPDEVRAWTIGRGSLAPKAARAIHSDLERGFIRAEVMKYADLFALGSEQKVREAGRLFSKGKDYIVEDGDILNILFHV